MGTNGDPVAGVRRLVDRNLVHDGGPEVVDQAWMVERDRPGPQALD
jgi:hypothetical protein